MSLPKLFLVCGTEVMWGAHVKGPLNRSIHHGLGSGHIQGVTIPVIITATPMWLAYKA